MSRYNHEGLKVGDKVVIVTVDHLDETVWGMKSGDVAKVIDVKSGYCTVENPKWYCGLSRIMHFHQVKKL